MDGKASIRTPLLREILLAESSSTGLARGCALGIALGLVPKTNLVAVAMLFAIFLARVNLLAAFACCIMVSLFAFHLDPLLDTIGASVLTLPTLQPLFRSLYSIPWVAWSGLDNTVVAGALIVGLLQWYPTQQVVQRYIRRSRELHDQEPLVQRIVT